MWGKRILAITSVLFLTSSGLDAAEASVVTELWVPSYEVCELVPGALCLQTEDGHVLQVTDTDVTLGGTDCIDLPETHGSYVRVYDNLNPELLEPDLTAQMRTGSCADGVVDEADTVFVDADTTLPDPIDASVGAGPTRFSGDATFYDTGLGACGGTNKDSDLVFALPASMFDSATPNGNPTRNPTCGRKAKVTRGNKSVVVTEVDRCDGCKRGDIDLSPAAFGKIGRPEEGRVKTTWAFVS